MSKKDTVIIALLIVVCSIFVGYVGVGATAMIKNVKINNLMDENALISDELTSTKINLENANATIAELKDNEYKLVYLGEYQITHYCCEKRAHICGTGSGKTATGTTVTAGRTVAIDPTIIPYGTEIYIEGYGWRVAEDCGGGVKNKQIDVAVNTHVDALSLGVKYKDVWILVKNN